MSFTGEKSQSLPCTSRSSMCTADAGAHSRSMPACLPLLLCRNSFRGSTTPAPLQLLSVRCAASAAQRLTWCLRLGLLFVLCECA